jgi:hypothetical protein
MSIVPATELPPTAMQACKCTSCGAIFTGITGFDDHRRNGKCLPPASIGMGLDYRGMWSISPRAIKPAVKRAAV